MDLSRADSTHIAEQERQQVLAEFGIPAARPFAIGSEAEVYLLDEERVLKLYADPRRFPYYETLRNLYASLDTRQSGLNLPQIQRIVPSAQLIAVVETRLAGVPLETVLPTLQGTALHQAEDVYLDAAARLRTIVVTTPPPTYLLFDETHASQTSTQSFATFYAMFLARKLDRVGAFFAQEDGAFTSRSAALVQAIQSHSPTPLSLVHGDFFPGNVLVSPELTELTGVIDFGSFTMFGNYLVDMAGAFGFYQMYAPDRQAIRERLLPRLLQRLAEAEIAPFFQFLLGTAILTCDLYADPSHPQGEGHFEWAREIITTPHYWDEALH